jgi:hypothetical protein
VQLGGSIDLSRVSARGIAICEPVSTKVAHLMRQLATAEAAGKITAAEADNVHGKCRWITSQHRMRARAPPPSSPSCSALAASTPTTAGRPG